MRLRVVGVVLVLAGVLAACSSDPKPPPFTPSPQLSTSSASPTPTPTPSRTGPLTTGPNVRPGEKPPVLTATAKQHTESGALAFATYFIKALDWSLATTDPYLLKQVSSPSCTACNKYIDRLDSLRRQGGHVQGGRITIEGTHLANGTGKVKADRIVQVRLVQGAAVVRAPTAAPSTISTRATVTSFIYLSWSAARRWQVVAELGP